MKSSAPVHRNLSDRVAHHLMEYIRENGLTSGEKVPSEVRISSDLKISRGIVREAYRSLRSAGIIEISAGRSPRVGALTNTSFTHLLQHALSTQQASPEQVLDLRTAIEVRAAELAAEKRTTADVKAMHRAVSAMRRSRSRHSDQFVQNDMQFHEIIGNATANPLFGLIASALREAMEASIRAGLESRTTQAQLVQVVESHQAIVDAIEARDPARAAASMASHFAEAKNALHGFFPSSPKNVNAEPLGRVLSRSISGGI